MRGRRWAFWRRLVARIWRWACEQFAPDDFRPRSPLPEGAVQRELERVHSLAAGRGPEPDEAIPYGDFSGAQEAERFAALPPIGPEAVDDVDWDALARALTRRA